MRRGWPISTKRRDADIFQLPNLRATFYLICVRSCFRMENKARTLIQHINAQTQIGDIHSSCNFEIFYCFLAYIVTEDRIFFEFFIFLFFISFFFFYYFYKWLDEWNNRDLILKRDKGEV